MPNKKPVSAETKTAILADLSKRYTLQRYIAHLEQELYETRRTISQEYGYKVLASKHDVCLQTISNFKQQSIQEKHNGRCN